MCICASVLFSSTSEWLNTTLKEAREGRWNETHYRDGAFKRFCGDYAFNGKVRGPQESNRPYPTTKFLPITMNQDHEIVRDAGLPSVIYQFVVGGGSLIPNKGQPLEAVGWYSDGTVAIGVVPYGNGKIILSNPHPNMSGKGAEIKRKIIMTHHAGRWGWTSEMIDKGLKISETNKDIDGPEPDKALAKSLLAYAFKKAHHQ